MVAESAPALVVVGESDGGGLALLSTLVLGPRGGSEAANGASPIEGPGPHALRLDTKYYTVDVAATVHTLPDEIPVGSAQHTEIHEQQILYLWLPRERRYRHLTADEPIPNDRPIWTNLRFQISKPHYYNYNYNYVE